MSLLTREQILAQPEEKRTEQEQAARDAENDRYAEEFLATMEWDRAEVVRMLRKLGYNVNDRAELGSAIRQYLLTQGTTQAALGNEPWFDLSHFLANTLSIRNPPAAPAPRTETAEAGGTAGQQTARSPVSAADLADMLGRPAASAAAVDSFLRRYRKKYPDCYITTETRRRNEPTYLYHVADVLPILKNHFAK